MQVARRVSIEKASGGRVSALSMYPAPPVEKLTVSEFEEFALDRLRCELIPSPPTPSHPPPSHPRRHRLDNLQPHKVAELLSRELPADATIVSCHAA